MLASFVAAYPRIHIEMETGLTARMPERLGKNFDLVIAMHPKARAAASCCGANRRSGPPPFRNRWNRRIRCRLRSIRRAAYFANGRPRHSMRRGGHGAWPS